MSSYMWWAAQQLAKQGSTWAAKHPGETALIGAALANPATRMFAFDVIGIIIKESWRTTLNTSRGIATAAVNRSTKVGWVWSQMQKLGSFAKRHPIGMVVAVDIAAATGAIALAMDEDPATQEAQMMSTSHALSGSGAGGGSTQPSVGSGGKWLIGGGSFF